MLCLETESCLQNKVCKETFLHNSVHNIWKFLFGRLTAVSIYNTSKTERDIAQETLYRRWLKSYQNCIGTQPKALSLLQK